MRNAYALLLALLSCPAAAIAADVGIPAELVDAVARAERLGKALAEAIPSARAASKATLKQAKKQGAELCSLDYKQASIHDGNTGLTYLIGTTKRSTDIVVGRHFLLADSGAKPSTRTCFDVGMSPAKSGQKLAFVSVTHILSPAPNEYHVYLSLTQPVPLIVLTEAGTWIVEKGGVQLESLRDDGLAPNAPVDRPLSFGKDQVAAREAAIAPYVARARETWPAARDRYLAGLPRGETFFVTTRLRDTAGRIEQVFIRVTRIAGGEISGQIANNVTLVEGYRSGQAYSFPDSELLDWLVAKPDGTEEGNFVGKFLDTYRP
jgi:hypothetical protein